MSKTIETAVDLVNFSDETLHNIVETLRKALEPKVFYYPNHHQMTEDALKASQNHFQVTLKKLLAVLPPTNWLIQKIVDVMATGEAVGDQCPF